MSCCLRLNQERRRGEHSSTKRRKRLLRIMRRYPCLEEDLRTAIEGFLLSSAFLTLSHSTKRRAKEPLLQQTKRQARTGSYSPSVSRTGRAPASLTILVFLGHTTLGTIASQLVSYTILCGLARIGPPLLSFLVYLGFRFFFININGQKEKDRVRVELRLD